MRQLGRKQFRQKLRQYYKTGLFISNSRYHDTTVILSHKYQIKYAHTRVMYVKNAHWEFELDKSDFDINESTGGWEAEHGKTITGIFELIKTVTNTIGIEVLDFDAVDLLYNEKAP
eukprot:152503_1